MNYISKQCSSHDTRRMEQIPPPPKTNYIDILLKFYSWLKVVPYSCIWDREASLFYLKSSRLRKILTGFLHLVIIIPSIKWAIEPLTDLQKNAADVTAFFRLFDSFSTIIMLLHMIYFVWRKQFLFIKLVNELFNQLGSEVFKDTKKYSWFVIFFIANMVIYRFFGIRGLSSATSRGGYAAEMVLNILRFSTAIMESDDSSPSSSSSHCWPFYLACLYYGIKYLITLAVLVTYPLYMLQHGLLISTLVGLRLVWRKFKREIEQHGLGLEMGVSTYSEVRRILYDFNELFSIPLLLIYLTNLTFISAIAKSTSCSDCTTVQNLVEKGDACTYLIYTVFIWWISSEIHNQIQATMREWVYSFHHRCHRRQQGGTVVVVTLTMEERLKLLAFMSEIETDGLGVSCKFFTISYNSFSSMLGLIVTYGIVAHQFNNQSS